ncbi:MAG: hypothetical protein HYS25_13650 [Ignavibacteriales bacterium]|nr:hypothetical protein [Ignavibacteriales bacterium]
MATNEKAGVRTRLQVSLTKKGVFMEHQKLNQPERETQPRQRLAITLDLSEPEPVKDIPMDTEFTAPLNKMLKEHFPALFEKEAHDGK